jgi:tetratricopeptide (TPR) repeat protein
MHVGIIMTVTIGRPPGRERQAISDFEKAISLDPSSIDVYMMRGYCYFEKGEFEKAVSDFQTVLKGKPDYPNLHYWLGMSDYSGIQKRHLR